MFAFRDIRPDTQPRRVVPGRAVYQREPHRSAQAAACPTSGPCKPPGGTSLWAQTAGTGPPREGPEDSPLTALLPRQTRWAAWTLTSASGSVGPAWDVPTSPTRSWSSLSCPLVSPLPRPPPTPPPRRGCVRRDTDRKRKQKHPPPHPIQYTHARTHTHKHTHTHTHTFTGICPAALCPGPGGAGTKGGHLLSGSTQSPGCSGWPRPQCSVPSVGTQGLRGP